MTVIVNKLKFRSFVIFIRICRGVTFPVIFAIIAEILCQILVKHWAGKHHCAQCA